MVLINNKEASANFGSILLSPEDTNNKENNMQTNEQQGSKTKLQQRELRTLKEFMDREEMDSDDVRRLLKQLDKEEKPEEEKNLSEEDDAVNYLLSGGQSDSVEDQAVDELLAMNKKRREDG